MTPSEKSDSERTIGKWSVRIARRGQPAGWVFLSVLDVNGAPIFQALAPEDDVALDVIQAIERAQAYTAACRGE